MIYFYLEVKMENQINVGDQNTQQIDQNPVQSLISIPEKPKLNYWMISTIILAVIFVIGGYYGPGMIKQNSKEKPLVQQNPTISPANQQAPATPMPSNGGTPEILKCVFNSKWFGFYFKYSKEKVYAGDSCYSEGFDYELTDYTWPSGVFGLTFYPRNNLSGKEWWRKYIFDEAGYLKEDKYVFDFSKTPNGVDKMTVSIDDNKVDQKVDHVSAGPFRASNYYFGEKWVIRDKVMTTGGPCAECEEFEESIKLTPIKED